MINGIESHVDDKTKKFFENTSSFFLKSPCFNQLVCLTDQAVVPG